MDGSGQAEISKARLLGGLAWPDGLTGACQAGSFISKLLVSLFNITKNLTIYQHESTVDGVLL